MIRLCLEALIFSFPSLDLPFGSGLKQIDRFGLAFRSKAGLVHAGRVSGVPSAPIGGYVSEAFSTADSTVVRQAGFDENTSWYAVQTMYRHEHRISRDLAAKGFPTYLPLLKETHQWSDRRKLVESPAFTGYVFVRQDASNRSRIRVLETPGVVSILGANRIPTPIPDEEIESLRRMIEKGAGCEKCACPPIGAMVEVQRGPLAGLRGRLLEVRNGFRLVLSIAAVSQAISAEVHLRDVSASCYEANP